MPAARGTSTGWPGNKSLPAQPHTAAGINPLRQIFLASRQPIGKTGTSGGSTAFNSVIRPEADDGKFSALRAGI